MYRKGTGFDLRIYDKDLYTCPHKDIHRSDITKIKFIRCPYERAVSCYYAAILWKIIDPRISFYGFLLKMSRLNLVKGHPLESQLEEPGGLHLKTQFAYDENRDIWDDIIQVENTKEGIFFINKKYEIKLKYENTRNDFDARNINRFPVYSLILQLYRKFKPGKIVGMCSSVKIPKHTPYIDYYNNTIRKLVEKIYERDIHNTDYTFKAFKQRYSRYISPTD